MSHITRCPHCQTLFRASPEQLSVSQGLVRCGQCQHVFNGRAHIVGSLDASVVAPDARLPTGNQPAPFDGVQRGTVFQGRPDGLAAAAVTPTALAVDAAPAPPTPPTAPVSPPPDALVMDFRVDVHHWMHDSLYHERRLASAIDYALALPSLPEEPAEDAMVASDGTSTQPTKPPTHTEPNTGGQSHVDTDPLLDSPHAHEAAPDATASAQPEFIRHAQQQAFWRRKSVRAALSLAALGLLASLAAQIAVQHSQVIAATHPASRPLLDRLCQYAHCSTQPLQNIDFLTIDSSSLELTQARTYTLTWSLRNHAGHWQAVPDLEISLLNAAEQVTIRRIVPGSEWSHQTELAPHSLTDSHHTLHVNAPDSAIAGYRLMILYPGD